MAAPSPAVHHAAQPLCSTKAIAAAQARRPRAAARSGRGSGAIRASSSISVRAARIAPGRPSSAQTCRKLLCGCPTPRRTRISGGTVRATGVSAKRALVPTPAPRQGSAATAAPKLRAIATRARDEDWTRRSWAASGMARARRSPSTGASATARPRPRPASPRPTRGGRSRARVAVAAPARRPSWAAPLIERSTPRPAKASVAAASPRARPFQSTRASGPATRSRVRAGRLCTKAATRRPSARSRTRSAARSAAIRSPDSPIAIAPSRGAKAGIRPGARQASR